MPGQHYTARVNQAGSTPLTDVVGNAPAEVDRAFRESTFEQESSLAARYRWRTVSNTGAYGGSYVVEHLTGATAAYSFTGSSITWYTRTGPSQGKALVYIDGVLKATVNDYATADHFKVARTFSVAAGTHTITIRASGLKGATAGTGTFVTVDAFKVGSGSVVSTPSLRYAWRTVASTSASGGRYAIGDLPGEDLTFTFRGTRIDWYTVTGSAMSKAVIYIDNIKVTTVDNYASSTHYGVLRRVAGLTDAVHTFRVVIQSTKNAASKGTGIVFDRFLMG
jgi:hypothetical protein